MTAYGAFRAVARDFVDRAWLFTKFACYITCFNNYVGEITICAGPSMLPTFNATGDIVLLEHISTKLDRLSPGDVVVAQSPVNPRMTILKRVLGLSGDVVTVLPANRHDPVKSIKVPEGHVWLQGDNQYDSTDSRHYGPVPYAMVVGRVLYRVWPPKDMGVVESRPP